jgi:N-acyl-D-aspartate/D-glutamate deacylase
MCERTSQPAVGATEGEGVIRDQTRLIDVAKALQRSARIVGAEARPPDWDWVFLMDTMSSDQRRMSDVERQRGVHPAEAMIDIALEHDFKVFFRQPIANEDQDDVLAMMKHPRSVVTFSDSGAHVAQIWTARCRLICCRTGCGRSRRSRWKKRCA